MWFGALAAAQQVFHALEVAWIETTAFLSKTWTNFTSDLRQAWGIIQNWLTKRWLDLMNLFGQLTDEQAAAAKQMADQDFAEGAAEIERRRTGALTEREQRRRSDREQSAAVNEATLAEIGRQFEDLRRARPGHRRLRLHALALSGDVLMGAFLARLMDRDSGVELGRFAAPNILAYEGIQYVLRQIFPPYQAAMTFQVGVCGATVGYCPDDELGLLACDFVLARAAELLDGTTEPELRRWLIERDPSIAGLFAKFDAGWKLPKNGDFTVDPSNAPAEARIIRHLLRERMEQCAGRPADVLAMDATGPIVAPAPNASTAGRATGCCRNKDEKDVPAGSKRCGKESTEA